MLPLWPPKIAPWLGARSARAPGLVWVCAIRTLTVPAPGGGGKLSGMGGAGFGPHPTGCLNGTDHKGYSLGEVSSCRNYEGVERSEREAHEIEAEGEACKSTWEIIQETVKVVVPVVKGCLAGTVYGAWRVGLVSQRK
jgi:hypothetical protein